MDIDKALAAGLTREIEDARRRALGDDRRSTFWTDRDVARRMTEAGWPMAHPAVIRARKGQRTVSVAEWLTFAFVLSVPPLRLIQPGTRQTLNLAGRERSGEEFARWAHGHAPTRDLPEPGIYYASPGLAEPTASHFAKTFRTLADQFDTATTDLERHDVAVHALSTVAGHMRAEQTNRTRKGNHK